jgi:hypothetical protein
MRGRYPKHPCPTIRKADATLRTKKASARSG